MSMVLIPGSFNPVTNAHVSMGVRAKELYPDAAVVYIPDTKRYLRESKGYCDVDILSDIARVQLLTEAVQQYGFTVSDVELSGVSDGKTYNTASLYRNQDPILCIGADNLTGILDWYRGDDIVREYRFLVFSRFGVANTLPDNLVPYKEHFTFTSCLYADVSSTMIRKAALNGVLDFVKSYIPECVYIFMKGVN